jgi:hypothetical protein
MLGDLLRLAAEHQKNRGSADNNDLSERELESEPEPVQSSGGKLRVPKTRPYAELEDEIIQLLHGSEPAFFAQVWDDVSHCLCSQRYRLATK